MGAGEEQVKIPFARLDRQYIEIENDVQDQWQTILANASFILGPQVAAFEGAFARYCGAKHCVGVGSGTDALMLALRGLDIGPGDEVVTAANSFVATAAAIVHAGAVPVLVDIDPETFNIDPDQIAAAVTPKTRAIIPVHLYGHPAAMAAIRDIARTHGLAVIEDAAQAHGACYHDRTVGTLGDAACFSFYPGKNLGAYGDGGAVVTNRDDLAQTIRKLRDHGGTAKYQHDLLGFNSRLDTLHAAVLLAKLPHLDRWNHERRRRAKQYRDFLADTHGVETPITQPHSTPVFHLYVIRVLGGHRDLLQRYLASRGIQTLIHYPRPITMLAPFSRFARRPAQHAEQAAPEILSLPLYPELEDEELAYVAEHIRRYMAGVQHRHNGLAMAESDT